MRKKRNLILILLLLLVMVIFFSINVIGRINDYSLSDKNIDINDDCVNCNGLNNEEDKDKGSDVESNGSSNDREYYNRVIVDNKKNANDNVSSNNNSNVGANNDGESGDFLVESESFEWALSTELDIFSNPIYKMKSLIAPNSSNTYSFNISNKTKYNLIYSIVFDEDNNYGLNMKYRLKRNGKYLLGSDNNWVSLSDVSVNDLKIKIGSSDSYSLEWKWFESDNDTDIGVNADVYGLSVNIVALGDES